MRTRTKILLAVGAVMLAVAGAAVAYVIKVNDRPGGFLDTELAGVSLSTVETSGETAEETTTETDKPEPPPEQPCWLNFGGNPQRTDARPQLELGPPGKVIWRRRMYSYIEYAPSYCDGRLYVNVVGVNTGHGTTYALDARTGRVIWRWGGGGFKASTPAIAGSRLLVSSHDGSVTALDREKGRVLWRLKTGAKVESSPVAIGDTAYFASTDGRLFAVSVSTGKVRWAYNTGGRINSSPSIFGQRICITTYAGSIFCLRRDDGHKLWSTYVKRDLFRYESFYASASTDGSRLYTISRGGKVVALSASSGRVLWTRQQGGYGYSTPAIAGGRIFVGGFDGALHAYSAESGATAWEAHVGGRILAAPVVLGNLVFFSTLERRTYAARTSDGKIVWRFGKGGYMPGIATSEHYYMSLGSTVIAFRPRKGKR